MEETKPTGISGAVASIPTPFGAHDEHIDELNARLLQALGAAGLPAILKDESDVLRCLSECHRLTAPRSKVARDGKIIGVATTPSPP